MVNAEQIILSEFSILDEERKKNLVTIVSETQRRGR